MAEIPLIGVPPEEVSDYEDLLRRLPPEVREWAKQNLQVVVLIGSKEGDEYGLTDDLPCGVTLSPSERWTVAVMDWAADFALLHEIAHAWLGHTRPRNDEDEQAANALASEWSPVED